MENNYKKFLITENGVGFAFLLIAESITIALQLTDSFGDLGLWIWLNIIPIIVTTLITGNTSHGVGICFHVASSIQWFIVGYFASKLYPR